jgi:acetyltransferase
MVGFGGICVEALKDTVTSVARLSHGEALEMLGELPMAPLLHGVRGEPPVNRSALADMMCRFAQLAVDVTDLREIELNPVVASPSGVVAVDARGTVE